jgi:hypothetical protein
MQTDPIDIEFRPSFWKRVRLLFWTFITGVVFCLLLASAIPEAIGIADAKAETHLVNRMVLFMAAGLMGWYLFFLLSRQCMFAIRVTGHEISYRSIAKNLRVPIEEIQTFRLMGRSSSRFSMTFKVWHLNGSFIVSNHEFDTRQVTEIAELTSRLFNAYNRETELAKPTILKPSV